MDHLTVVSLIASVAIIAVILTMAVVGSTVLQQRRLLRARETFGGRLLAAQDEERAAIARELHDDTIQRLVAIATDLRAGREELIAPAAARLDKLAEDVRAMARGMHPSVVDHLELHESLLELSAGMTEREALDVRYQGTAAGTELSPARRLALYRVAQEALGNVVRHAGIDRASMELRAEGNTVILSVEDEGEGFDMDEVAGGPGIGITSMRERLHILGGGLTFEARPGRGTRITATLPKEVRP